ncbi:MAG: cytochrome C oxidase subunit IV family protein [Bacteroidetes bacterium]|nr:cytochrome C oxidase subunit IV family protein [Bacteroidota bacterium]MBS1648928.1 cytochrome C oxidase subunit IV family protein [Bacteroidota bacterium]
MQPTTHAEQHGNKHEIRNVTIILTVLTLLELSLGFAMMKMADGSTAKISTKIAIIILMLAKAYYIVGYFMHLKHEIRNLIMTIVVPLTLFIWFIIAFLGDGESYKNLRNTYDAHKKAVSTQKVEVKKEVKEVHVDDAKH